LPCKEESQLNPVVKKRTSQLESWNDFARW
jgi:hypothetical protein